MGVYIDMEMPKDGAFVEVLIWSDGHVTQTGDSYFPADGRAYYQPCAWKYFSAVPIPPHGRLIDADAYKKLLRGLGNRDYRREAGTLQDAIKLLHPHYAPTIIPAEEE